MPQRAPSQTAQALVPTPASLVSMEAAAWSATATTLVTVISRHLTGLTVTTVGAVGGRPGGYRESWDEGQKGNRGTAREDRRGQLGSGTCYG